MAEEFVKNITGHIGINSQTVIPSMLSNDKEITALTATKVRIAIVTGSIARASREANGEINIPPIRRQRICFRILLFLSIEHVLVKLQLRRVSELGTECNGQTHPGLLLG